MLRKTELELSFEYHLSKNERIFGRSADELGPIAVRQAQLDHSLCIMDGLLETFLNIVNSSYSLKNENAIYYMRSGAGLRLNMIWYSYRSIIFTCDPGLRTPLSHEQQLELNRDINVVYMNIRGVLDNFAWTILYEKMPNRISAINKRAVDLFGDAIKNQSEFKDLYRNLSAHSEWNLEVKERRDPVAHRIPLRIPPSILTSEESVNYKELYDAYIKAAGSLDFDTSDQRFADMGKIGQFVPVFVHDPAGRNYTYLSNYP